MIDAVDKYLVAHHDDDAVNSVESWKWTTTDRTAAWQSEKNDVKRSSPYLAGAKRLAEAEEVMVVIIDARERS
jgi:hypothetical protein